MEGRGGLFQYRQVVGRVGEVAVGDGAPADAVDARTDGGIWLVAHALRSAPLLGVAIPEVSVSDPCLPESSR
jgi:hypothetical protein